MKNTKLLYNIRHLLLPITTTPKYCVQLNSIQAQCLFHTNSPLMNKDMVKIDRTEEQPHMRLQTNTLIENKRTYQEEYW